MSARTPHARPAEPVPVVLAGARGHGHWHLNNLRRLADAGRVTLAGVCELKPLDDSELQGFTGVAQCADFGDLLDRTGARVAIICTPIPTHTDLALTAAARGVHLLLEKPPAPSYAEYERMAAGVAEAGTACQVGFQSLGSHAVSHVRDLVRDGLIGEPLGIGAAGAWARGEAYFRRAPWAGRRRLPGGRGGSVDVVDGVLTNPLAHAVATGLALDGATGADDLADIRPELFRANDIEADDTSYLGLTTRTGSRVTVAATLCAERADEPYVIVHGSRGRITFWYKQDRVLVQRAGHGPEETVHGRTDLLENLLDHLTDPAGATELLVTPASTGAFMRVVEAIRLAPEPVALPDEAWSARPVDGGDGGVRRVVHGIDGLVAASADSLTGYTELGASWARTGQEAAT
ncbi:Gfo/Idh/MocA family protein [Streptomyces sp. VRA16 Mangrove soil]|uniref:Gfo/Idh/MocA family protein n=1 Tax=Streptomyces sp. VRA16 Mangrove soil TaxID=2817434 RepID=UPI001A9F7902|nr:Gfo/Idh/MocA family oxidoreductase [Streptomyces sp. VRA16 Mangrove soil]MBO1335261.1 Gfo/Idh/MocA family oxidoreductase [Streptomyces sp. VRA16 Mangrove soil]